MPEVGNYFAWLGLTPGVYSERELSDRLTDIRGRGLDGGRVADATVAYSVLRDPERQARHLRQLQEAAGSAAPPAGGPSPAIEDAFAAATTALLEAGTGVLRYSNRRRLLALASQMGIAAFEANLLIERARFRATLEPAWMRPRTSETPSNQPARSRRRARRWIVAIAIAVLLDAIALAVLLR